MKALAQPPLSSTAGEGAALRSASRVALVALFLALVASLFFWQERMFFSDAAHILFRIINDGTLQIQEHRFGSFVTQGIALLGTKAGLPLKALVMLYSASFTLFYFAAGIILHRWCRRYDLVLLLAGYHLLLGTSAWYWTNNEVHQGITWLLLVYGIVFGMDALKTASVAKFAVLTAGCFLALFTHPLVMLPAVALWGFWLIEGSLPFHRRAEIILATVILLAIAAIKFKTSTSGWYDGERLLRVQHLKFESIFKAVTAPVTQAFVTNLLTSYPAFLLLFAMGIVALVRKRKWLLLTWSLLNVIGYLLLVSMTYDFFDRFYIESEWMGIAVIGIAPAVYYAFPAATPRKAVAIISSAVLLCFVIILNASGPFTKRLNTTRQTLDNMAAANQCKAVIPDTSEALRKSDILLWGAPLESMMMSQIRGDVPQRTFLYEAPDKVNDILTIDRNTMREAFATRSKYNLNPRYFQMDTTQTYSLLIPHAPDEQQDK